MTRLVYLLIPLALTAAALPAAYQSTLRHATSAYATATAMQIERGEASLQIEVKQVESDEGHVLVALYSEASTWTDPEAAYATAKVKAEKGTVIVDFADIASGTYGIALLHDADDSGDMTTNFMGIPKEAYGFGNDARGRFSAPDFEESTVVVDGPSRVTVHIK